MKKVFVIMPFQDQFFEVYEMLKMQFSDTFEFSNAGDEGNQQNILKDIIQPIYEADVIIADLSGLNPNVMYELGLAHTFNKKTIMITQDELSKLPFDLKQYRAKDYSTHFRKFAELIDYLKVNLYGAIDDSVIYSNPVKDFLDSAGVSELSLSSVKEIIDFPDDSDKGFIDYLADIEANTNDLSISISDMTKDLQEMSEGINQSSQEIERVNRTGGSGTASFVRKETKKAAKYVEAFSIKLKSHNKKMSEQWDEIEKNTIGLLENQFSSKTENREGLVSFLKSLCEIKTISLNNLSSIEDLRTSMQSVVGLERSMNQAVRFADEDLKNQMLFIERLCKSIDKILSKSRLVIGDFSCNE